MKKTSLSETTPPPPPMLPLQERRNHAFNHHQAVSFAARGINTKTKMAPDKQQEVPRPTEAQLRWAQFHRKQRVQDTHERIERLWQTPASVSDVEGALSNDGVTTDSSSSCSKSAVCACKKRKPKISRGRRAMLRVSRRAYESRRICIQHEGFYASAQDENDEDDELAHMFQEHVVKRRKRNRRSHGSQTEEEERVRRFEAAYRAMMTNLAQPAPVTIESSKRWTRTVEVSNTAIDGTQYDDLKWGFKSRKHSVGRVVASPTTPVDRRASWLVHLPHRQPSTSSLLMRRYSSNSSSRVLTVDAGGSSPRLQPPPCSPGKAKFDELVAKIQNRSLYGDSSLMSPEYRREKGYGVENTTAPVQRLPPSRKFFFAEQHGNERRRLSPKQKEPFLQKRPNESQEQFERRREYFKRQESKHLPQSQSQREFDLTRNSFERRHCQRMVKRDQFFRALQAPYMSAAAKRSRKRVYGTPPTKHHANKLPKERRQLFDGSKVPKLCRKQQAVRSPSVGARVGGLLAMFSTGRDLKEEASIQQVQRSLFPNDEPTREALKGESPVATLSGFFSGNNKESQSSGKDDDDDDKSIIRELQAFAKMAAGIKMTAQDRVEAATAYQKMVSGKNLSKDENVSFQKFCSDQELNPSEASHAAAAYHKVVSGQQLTSKQEAAYRMLVSGEEVTSDQITDALEGYQKLIPSSTRSGTTVTIIRKKREVAALGKLAAGMTMSLSEEKDAEKALQKLMTGKQLSMEEEDAYRKLVSGHELSQQEEDLAVLAYSKVVSGLTNDEENAFGNFVDGQDLTAKEEELALAAYTKLVPPEDDYDDEDEFFSALRKLSGGYIMTPEEEFQAAAAYQKLVGAKSLPNDQEAAYRKLVTGETLSSADEDLATDAYRTLVGGTQVTDEQEAAFRKVVMGDSVTGDEEVQALAAWRKLVASKDGTDEEDGSDFYSSDEDEQDEEGFFQALRKLAVGYDMTQTEEVKAAAAYRDVISGVYLNGAQRASFQRFVSGQKLDREGTHHAATAYHKLVTMKQLPSKQELACRKMLSGQKMTDEEAANAFVGYRALVFAKVADENVASTDYSGGEFVERQTYFKQRNSQRLVQERRERFVQELQAPYTSAKERRDAKVKGRIASVKKQTQAKHSLELQNQQTADVSKIPKLSRKQRDAYVAQEQTESSENANRLSLSIGTKVGGILGMFSGSDKSVNENEPPNRLQKLQRSLFSGVIAKTGEIASMNESPLASFRSFFSGSKKDSPSITDSPKRVDVSSVEAQELMAFGKMAAGENLTTREQLYAATAYQKMVSGKGLNEVQDNSFQKFVSGQDLDPIETDHAATAYHKVVSGKEMTGKQEAAYRMLVSGEKLTDEQATDALAGYRKLILANFVPVKEARTHYASQLIDKEEVAALGKLSAGLKMAPAEAVRARDALQKITFGKQITLDQEDAYRKLISGQELTAQEEDLAIVACHKVVFNRGLTESEEIAYERVIAGEGEEMTEEEEAQALTAYRKLISIPQETDEENEDSFFDALRKLSAGYAMTEEEEVQAAAAYQKIVATKSLSCDQEDAYRKLVSGGTLTSVHENLAMEAHRMLAKCAQITNAQEDAFGKVVAGDKELTAEEEIKALAAYKKLVSIPKETDEENEDSFFDALRKLSGGYVMTEHERVQADMAYQKMVAAKPLPCEQEAAYRRLVSGEVLTPVDEDLAMNAYQTLVACAQITNAEEKAFRKVVTGDADMTAKDEAEALAAYKNFVSISKENNEEEEDSFFDALRKLSGGYAMTKEEKAQAEVAYQKMVTAKPLSAEQEAAYRKLVSGGTLTIADEDLATDAYRTLVNYAHITSAEENAFRKVVTGDDITNEDQLHAFAAYRKFVSSHEVDRKQEATFFEPNAKDVTDSFSEEEDEEDFFCSLRKLAAGYDMTPQEEINAAAAYRRMVSGNHLNEEQDSCFQKLVSGQDLDPKEASHAAAAYHKVVSGKAMTGDQEAAYRKLVSGEELSDDEANHAFEGYRKLIKTKGRVDDNLAERDNLTFLRNEQLINEVAAVGKLAAGSEMTPTEESQAHDALNKMLSGKDMTPDQEDVYRKLVSGQELTADEEDLAIIAYRKVVFGRGLTNDEENAYGKLVDGQNLNAEEASQALAAYSKLVSDPLKNNSEIENTVRAVTALHTLASGLPISEEAELQAVAAYQSMVAGKQLSDAEDASYRKLVCGAELTPDEEDRATAAYHKVLSDVEVSQEEEIAYRKLVSGQELTDEEEMLAVYAFSKIVSDDILYDDPFTIYQKLSTGESLTYDEEIEAVAAFKRIQDERRVAGDAGSTSSFRALPDGIRRVVQSFASPRSLVEENYVEEDEAHSASEHNGQPFHFSSSFSPSRSGISRSSVDELTPEQMKMFHQKVMESSALIGEGETDQTIIDTDETTSDASGAKMDPKMAASLMLSPTILTKRHQQAIRAIEKRKWDQVSYILNANPWLAEMTDVMTSQYLLHKLSFYGASVVDVDPETGEVRRVDAPAAPEQLSMDMIRMFPSSVHKFDQDGNLPLHMAAASGNVAMITLLGERFPSGASVRNNDGFLPLHLAIMSCSSPFAVASEKTSALTEAIKLTLKLFPEAVGVTDNEGNLPLHTAASTLQGDVGVDAIYMLLDEADRQANSGKGLRFSEFKPKHEEDESVSTEITSANTDSETVSSDTVHCTMVRNNDGHNSLVTAIRSMAGWEIVEAIVGGPGGQQAALHLDTNKCNALHLLVSGEFADPASILSILKAVPQAAAIRNNKGMLPIEAACMQQMPREVILALVLVDLPLDLDDKDGVKVREGFGGSWWFLTCECDDHHVDVVKEVISICTYSQIRELCFMKGGAKGSSGPVISRATPKCRSELRKALRFVGRFEFLGSSALHTDSSLGLKVFEALDFGTEESPHQEGRRTLLYCYGREDTFRNETAVLRKHKFDQTLVEEAFDFAVHELENQTNRGVPQQFCVAVERPAITLDKIASSMSSNREYQLDSEMRGRYLAKVCAVLRSIAKAILHLHSVGVVHTDLCPQNCGKFEDKWKLMGLLETHLIGAVFDPSTMGASLPPECVELLADVVETHSRGASRRVIVKSRFAAETSIDIWAFGKLVYEVLTGEPLIPFDPEKEFRQDNRALRTLMKWNEYNLRQVTDSLERAGISVSGVDLVSRCLLPNPQDRPPSINDVLVHAFWSDMRRKGGLSSKSKPQSRRRGDCAVR